jgi:SAM-dependent methyltransferase
MNDDRRSATREELDASLAHMFVLSMGFSGTLTFACLPEATELIVERLIAVVNGLGRQLGPETIAALRASVSKKTSKGYATSPHHRLIVKYASDGSDPKLVNFEMSVIAADAYSAWSSSRAGQSQFGERPDAKAVAIARELGLADLKILDVGAGTGRNAFPLAALGGAVDAVELNADFAKQAASLAAKITDANFPRKGSARQVNFITGDFLDARLRLPRAPYDFVLLAEVLSSHARDVSAVHAFLLRIRACLRPCGMALCSLFICDPPEALTALARQIGNHYLSCVFTERDIAHALEGTGLARVAQEPVAEFERAAALTGTWPPTPWFEDWAAGRNVFGLSKALPSPVALVWLTLRAI